MLRYHRCSAQTCGRNLKMRSRKEQFLIEREKLEEEFPNIPQGELDDLAEEATTDYFAGYADYMIDRTKDERIM